MDMTRIEKVIEDMRKMNLEQFLVTDPMAVYYLTGQYYASRRFHGSVCRDPL